MPAGAAATFSTSEAGRNSTLALGLRTRPTSAVSCVAVVSDATEGAVPAAAAAFSPSSWAAVELNVTGIRDSLPDGQQPFTVRFEPCTSADSLYSGASPTDVLGDFRFLNDDVSAPSVSAVSPEAARYPQLHRAITM